MKRFISGRIKFVFIILIFTVIITMVFRYRRHLRIIEELDLNKNAIFTNSGNMFNYTYEQKSFFLAVYEEANLYYKSQNKWVLVDTMTDVEPELKEVYSCDNYIVYCEINKMYYYVVFLDSNKIVNLTEEILNVLSEGENAVFGSETLSETKEFILNYMSESDIPSLNQYYLVIKEYLK